MRAGPTHNVGGVNNLDRGVKPCREVSVDGGQVFHKAGAIAKTPKPLETQEGMPPQSERHGRTRLEERQFAHGGASLAYSEGEAF